MSYNGGREPWEIAQQQTLKGRVPVIHSLQLRQTGGGRPPRLNDSAKLNSQFSSAKVMKKYPPRLDPPPAPSQQTEVLKLVPKTYQIIHTSEPMNIEATDQCEVDGVIYDDIESVEGAELVQHVELFEEQPSFEGIDFAWNEYDESVRKCKSCNLIMPQLEMLEHVRAFHRGCTQARGFPPRPTGNLWCPYPHCKVCLYSYEYLIAHLIGYHNQEQFKREEFAFNNEDELRDWLQKHEEKEGKLWESPDVVNEYSEDGITVIRTQKMLYCERNAQTFRSTSETRAPTVACPFLCTIETLDNGFVILSGTTCHLGHKKTVPMVLAPKNILRPQKTSGFYKEYRCHPCRRVFPDPSTLQYHQRLRHGVITMLGGQCRRPNIMCAECDGSFENMPSYVSHVKEDHLEPGHTMKIESHLFHSTQELEDWKNKVENETCALFVCSSGKVRPKNTLGTGTSHQYLQCYRSGHQSRNHGVDHVEKFRRRKSKKINAFCTAYINIAETSRGLISVKCCLSHFGHDIEPEHLPLSKFLKSRVEDLLRLGKDFDDIRESIANESQPTERGYFLKKYEVVNVAKRLVRLEPFIILNNRLVPESADVVGSIIEDTGRGRNRNIPLGFDTTTRLLLKPEPRTRSSYAFDTFRQEPDTLVFPGPSTSYADEGLGFLDDEPSTSSRPPEPRQLTFVRHRRTLDMPEIDLGHRRMGTKALLVDDGIIYDPRAPNMEIRPAIKKTPLLMLPTPSEDGQLSHDLTYNLQDTVRALKYEVDPMKIEDLRIQKAKIEAKIAELVPQTKSGNRLMLDVVDDHRKDPPLLEKSQAEHQFITYDHDFGSFEYPEQDDNSFIDPLETIDPLGDF